MFTQIIDGMPESSVNFSYIEKIFDKEQIVTSQILFLNYFGWMANRETGKYPVIKFNFIAEYFPASPKPEPIFKMALSKARVKSGDAI